MKSFALFAGFVGALFVVMGANAADPAIQTATTNRVRNSVYNITYGAPNSGTAGATNNDYGYRHGTVPQNRKLTAIEGADVGDYVSGNNWRTTDAAIDGANGVTVGNLASTSAGTNQASGTPTESIKANKANIAVLKRDKLSVAATGNCSGNNVECGYVTTGTHANQPLDGGNGRVWMKIVTCTNVNDPSTCNG